MDYRVCSRCGEKFPATLEYFYKVNNGLNTRCKSCIKEYKKIWYEKNETEILRKRKDYYFSNHKKSLEKSKIYRDNNKSVLRVRELEINYGLREDEIRDIMDYQRGCCAICGDSLITSLSKRSFCVDHNHNTGTVRGLLCHNCNSSLGLLKENVSILEKMIKYIEDNKDV